MEKRKLKRYQLRIPKVKVSINEIIDEVSNKTGFSKTDIKIVYRSICMTIKEKILEKKSVTIPHLGIIFPRIRPERRATDMARGKATEGAKPKVITVPARYTLQFNGDRTIKQDLLKLNISKEEIDDIYVDLQ